jgi:hypothetical protein
VDAVARANVHWRERAEAAEALVKQLEKRDRKIAALLDKKER